MSSHPVKIVIIDKVDTHDNADRLEIARVAGWQSIIGKGQFQAGDWAVYVPIDSLLSEPLESYLFPTDSKIRLEKSRVRSIKIRGALSQGLLVSMTPELLYLFPQLAKKHMGDDVADVLGIIKYEPPEQHLPKHMRATPKRKINPWFSKFTDIENFKHYPDLFQEGEEVWVSEKLHGSSVRFGLLPTAVNSWWRRFMKKLHLLPRYEYVYGSRNVQLQERHSGGFYEKRGLIKLKNGANIYEAVGKNYGFKNILKPGEILYGEIIGHNIQKGYDYGLKNDWAFYAYDVKKDGVYLDPEDFILWCGLRGVHHVPTIYSGPYNKEAVEAMASGPSILAPEAQPMREGIVIKPMKESLSKIGRLVLKFLNDDFLLIKNDSQWH